jgi:hypothetical protein
MVIGGALVVASDGALTPMAAAMMTGAGYTAATGSLKKGLMAGLGAYGGAGLGAGIADAGASALGTAGQTTVGAAGLGGPELPTALGSGNMGTALSAPIEAPIAAAPVATPVLPPTTPAASIQGYGNAAEYVPEMAPQAAAAAPIAPVTADVNPTDMRLAQGMQTAPTQLNPSPTGYEKFGTGLKSITNSSTDMMNFAKANSGSLMFSGAGILGGMGPSQSGLPTLGQNPAMIRPYTSDRTQATPQNMIGANFVPGQNPDTSARQWFANNNQYTAGTPYLASTGNQYPSMAGGGPVEAMSNANAIGANTGYPQASIRTGAYATPSQMPISQNIITGSQDANTDPYTGEPQFAAGGGISDAHHNLGGYSDGGRLLRGPGDGVSDDIPAIIGKKQPARLADGEFVIPARIVSELGNGSTEAGARQLYSMMERIQSGRQRSIGKNKVATNTRAARHLPA